MTWSLDKKTFYYIDTVTRYSPFSFFPNSVCLYDYFYDNINFSLMKCVLFIWCHIHVYQIEELQCRLMA